MGAKFDLLRGGAGLIAASVLGLAPAAHAVDGVREINQSCVASGCSDVPGDSAGWPVTIAAPGSYRLTSNLTVPNANTDAIDVTVPGVSIDLNQFAILGPTSCTACPATSCTGTGTGRGVSNSVSLAGGVVSVQNGAIRGMGAGGIAISGGGVALEEVLVNSNGGAGVNVIGGGGAAFRVGVTFNAGDGLKFDPFVLGAMQDVQAVCNANEGIEIGVGSTVAHSTAVGNGGTGIYTQTGSSISGSVAVNNASIGIRGVDTTFIGNAARGNTGDGFLISGGSTVTANTAQGNGGIGFNCGDGVIISNSVARSNTGFGISGGAGTGYISNSLTCNNSAGVCNNVAQVGGVATNLGLNICGTDTTCP